ncbi:MAG TPA: hypothetical protein P5200_12855, partial [Tenuifilaceae bacterium]|nr:hypothetical protein [Tenuifilaceae bacterium]
TVFLLPLPLAQTEFGSGICEGLPSVIPKGGGFKIIKSVVNNRFFIALTSRSNRVWLGYGQ